MRPPKLERYEILEELGQGGMSVVYRARDRQLSRDVAVKVLHSFLASQADARHRFHREAVAVAKLRHPSILEIFDYSGPEAEDAYIVTELISGGTLRDFLEARGGRLREPELGLLLIAEVTRALQHAHGKGVVHRDIKPENVMFTQAGALKLMDFGIAQVADAQRLTQTGTLLGSPAHMAPEVIDGGRPDERSDLFSLGTVLYWVTTGVLPFEAANPSALFKQILDGRYEDPQMLDPRIGNGLARIIRKLLEIDPDERYASAAELHEALTEELECVGLTPAELELRKFLDNPDTYASDLGARLIETLTEVGRQALADQRIGAATDAFNRVLAREPNHPEVTALARKAMRRQELSRRLKQASIAVGVAAIAAAAIYAGYVEDPAPGRGGPPLAVSGAPAAARDLPGATLGGSGDLVVDPDAGANLDGAALGAPDDPRDAATGQPGAIDDAGQVEGRATPSLDSGRRRDRGVRADPVRVERTPVEPVRPGDAPSASGTDAGPSQLEDGGAPEEERDAGAEQTPSALVRAPLRVVIGGSYADIELTNVDEGSSRRWPGVIERKLSLRPGRYRLSVAKPGYGRFRPRRIEVFEDGRVVEHADDGRTRDMPSTLRLRVPEPGKPAADPDWIPDAS